MNLSFILPFYKKAQHFRTLLPVNECFHEPDVEVVCVLDEPTEEQLVLDLVHAFPTIKFRVIVNDWDHPWRPPCMAFNVGIRNSTGQHLVFVSPESAIILPHRRFLQELVSEDFRMCYSGVCWMEDDIKIDDPPKLIRHKIQVSEAVGQIWHAGSGFLLAPKIAVNRIFGFDENRTGYGFDDDDLRIRLLRLGYRITIDGRIKVFHSHHEGTDRTMKCDPPAKAIALSWQHETWGQAFNRCPYRWDK